MLIAVDARPLQEQYGGVPEYTRLLLGALARLPSCHEYVLFMSGVKSFHFSFEEEKNGRFHVVRLRVPNKLLNASLACARRPFLDGVLERKMKRKIDLFFTPNIHFLSLSPTMPHVITAHDLSFEHYPFFLKNKQRLWHALVNPQKLFTSACHIIAVSHSTKKDLERCYKVAAGHISVISLACNPSFRMPSAPLADALPERYILLFSAHEQRKNVLHFLSAFQYAWLKDPFMRSFRVVCIGDASRGGFILRACRYTPLKNSVLFLPFVSDKVRASLYARASLLAYPSIYEGFGLPVLEAQTMGVPVLASSSSSIGETAGKGALLAHPFLPSQTGEALIALLKDDRLRERCIEEGKRNAARFSWEATARRTEEVFEKVFFSKNHANRH